MNIFLKMSTSGGVRREGSELCSLLWNDGDEGEGEGEGLNHGIVGSGDYSIFTM